MDYYLLTDLAVTMGYHLAMSGAETFRVEDTIHRILRAYGVECEVFAIPNCVSVSLEAANGKPLMLMRRIGFHGNDLEKLEKLNELSRRICAERPEVDTAMSWLEQTLAARRSYSAAAVYLGNLLVGLGFCLVFGGTLLDCLWAGVMGLIIGVVTRFMDKQEANPFFSTILASCLMALPAYAAAGLGWLNSPDAAIIGTLMILVPGLLITNSMRDIIYGDTNSGIFRIVQVFLTALAIALGTAAAWHLTAGLYGQTASATVSWPAWAQAIAVFIGCCGFCILFNVHGRGMVLCVAGGVDAVSAVAHTGLRRVRRQPVCRRVCGAVCRGHGAPAEMPGHALSGHRHAAHAAGRRCVLHHEPGVGWRDDDRRGQGTGNGGHRRLAGGGYPAGVHGVPADQPAARVSAGSKTGGGRGGAPPAAFRAAPIRNAACFCGVNNP